MTQLSTLAVNVFGEENKANETTPNQNTQTPADQPEAKTPSTEQGTNTTTQLVTARDDGSNLLVNSVPWIAAGTVAIVILISLFVIIRKLNSKTSGNGSRK